MVPSAIELFGWTTLRLSLILQPRLTIRRPGDLGVAVPASFYSTGDLEFVSRLQQRTVTQLTPLQKHQEWLAILVQLSGA